MFDSVDHYCLWKKLVQLGISQQTLTILQSVYSKAVSRVKLSNHKVTDQFCCEVGVRQGCNLSPLLFSLFISGLETELGKNKMGTRLWNRPIDLLMYADDIVMSSSEEGLRKHLRSLEEFCKEWKLETKPKYAPLGKNQDYWYLSHLRVLTWKWYRHTNIWECGSQQTVFIIKLSKPRPTKGRRLYLHYKDCLQR